MHIMKLTPNMTFAESWFKRCFLFYILSLTSWKELLYNSTFSCQIQIFRRHLYFEFKFDFPPNNSLIIH